MDRTEIRDSSNRLLYYTKQCNERLEVRDNANRLLGYCKNGETRDASNRLVCRGEAPGVLFGRV